MRRQRLVYDLAADELPKLSAAAGHRFWWPKDRASASDTG